MAMQSYVKSNDVYTVVIDGVLTREYTNDKITSESDHVFCFLSVRDAEEYMTRHNYVGDIVKWINNRWVSEDECSSIVVEELINDNTQF